MTIPSKNIQNDAYEAIGHGSRASFPNITGGFTQQIQQALAKHLEEKEIDFKNLSTQEKHDILTKFLETSYDFSKDLLPPDMKRDAIAQQNYFLDEILHDSSLSDYTHKAQGSVPMTESIVVTTIKKILALSGLPVSMIQEIKNMLNQGRDKPIFTSINAFRSELQKIIDTYDPSIKTNAGEKLTSDQMQALMNLSIQNDDIIDTLKAEGHLDDATYNTLKTEQYEKRPEEYQRAFATQVRKQFTYSYMDGLNRMKNIGDGISGLITVPKIRDVVASYCKKLDIDYSEFVDKQKPGLNFSSWSKEEKQALMDTMVEEYYIPSAEKFAPQMGLDVAQYKDFVKKLFSLDEKKLTIPGPDGNQIDLNFLHKDIGGMLTVDSVDGLGGQPIPFDFVLDGSDGQQMQKIASTMPYKLRHTIDGVKYDPAQQLSLQINGKTISGYGHKIMHDGVEQYLITDKPIPTGSHTNGTKVLGKDGERKYLKNTKPEDVVLLSAEKQAEQEDLQIGPKDPIVYSMQPHDVSGLLTAYCLNNSTNLSEQDKKALFVEEPKPQKLSDMFKDQILGNDEDNKKAIEDKEQYGAESSEGYAQRMEQERESAFKAWNAIPGHKEAKFERGSLIAIQNVDSIFTEIPGNGGHTILELTRCDNWAQPTKFKYKVVGGTETDIIDADGKSLIGEESSELPFSDKWFTKLRDFGRGTMYKFSPQGSQNNVLDYIKTLDFDNPGMNKFRDSMEMLSFKDGKIENNAKEEIKYFGTGIPTYNEKDPSEKAYVMFETKFSGDRVSIKDKNGSYARDMSFAQFVIFMADKGLRPYSQTQYDEDIAPIEMNNAKSKKAFFVMSPKNIINGVTKWRQGTFVEGAKRSNDRRVEKIEEMFYTGGMTSWLSNIPIYGEYFAQAQDEFNTKIADKHHKIIMEGDSTINQRGRKIVRGKETYIKNHNLKGQYRIKALKKIESLFLKVQNGGSLDDVERREAMAGLLYVLDKFGVTYPMILSKYAGQHLWPRLLLNDTQYARYIRGFNEAKHKLEMGQARGEDVRELMDAVMHYDVAIMSELMKDEYHRYLYGFKTIPVLQEHGEKRKNEATRQDGKKAAGNHPAFERAYIEEVQGRMRKGEYGYVIGALVQLSQRKEIANPVNYRRWLGGVMQMLLSGGMRYAANRTDRKYLRDFLRKHGFPFADFILDNAQGGKDFSKLIDVISRNAGCSGYFLKETGWTHALDSYEGWGKGEANINFMKSFDKRFIQDANAQKVIPFLQNSNMADEVSLATIADDPKTTDDEKAIIKRYLTVAINAHPGRDYDAYNSGEDFVNNLIQDHTVFNVSRQLVQSQYMNFNSDGNFDKNEEYVGYFWDALKNQFAGYAAKPKIAKPGLQQILLKYYTLFQQSYGGDHQWFMTMLAYMKNNKDPQQRKRYAHAAITAYIKKNKSYAVFPAMMSAAFAEVERFFVNHIDDIDDTMIKSLIDYGELEGTKMQKNKAWSAYEMMSQKDIIKNRPEENKAVQVYMKDLLGGKIRGGGSEFKGFDVLNEIPKDDGYENDVAAMEGINAIQAATDAAEQQAAQKQASEKADQEKREREERERKEREEQEKKEREQQEIDAEK